MKARVSARSFRIATAESQRSKIGKIRGTGDLANRCHHSPPATSHTFNRSFTPFLERCWCVIDVLCTSYMRKSFAFLLAEISYKYQDWENEFCYCDEYLPLPGFQGVDWTKKSKFLLAVKQSSTVAGSCKHPLVSCYTPPSACTILSFPASFSFGFFFFGLPHH